MKHRTNVEQFQYIIQYAVQNGWQPKNHDGEHLTGTHPEPELLKFSLPELIETHAFQALFLERAFLEAIFGQLQLGEILEEILLEELPGAKIQYVYDYIRAVEAEESQAISLRAISKIVQQDYNTEKVRLDERLINVIKRNKWLLDESSKLDPEVETIIAASTSFEKCCRTLVHHGFAYEQFGMRFYEILKDAIQKIRETSE